MHNVSDITKDDSAKKLGTFAGVFTPSILTILGIILFLRTGFVLGSAGLMRTLVIIAIASTISVLTSISIAAVATNLKVKGGGIYYLISRTLGVEFGGALGIVLFLAQSVSIAFYCIGFGEAVGALSAHPILSTRVIAFCAVAVLFILAWLGADWATRFQYVVMAFVATALLSFYIGASTRWESALVVANWHAPSNGPPFWLLFAIFFPAVTGFTQGVNMSGDLADPGRSLTRGTFLAVGLSTVVYFSVTLLMAGTLPLEQLSTDPQAMQAVSRWGVLIDAGVISATLSSAMASFLGAPRILQSLAADRVFAVLGPFAKGHGTANNPRRAVLCSAVVAIATIAIGNLNMVAAVVTMSFLISYGLLNYATYFEAKAGSPSFRPRFRFFHQRLSFCGALACIGTMLVIDPFTGLVAVSIIFAVYQYLQRTAGPSRWADSRRSYHVQMIKEHLHELSEHPDHPRDWRPYILAFSNGTERRRQLLQLSDWIAGRSGFTTVVRILEGTGGLRLRHQKEAELELRQDIGSQGFAAFHKVVCAPDPLSVLSILVQSHGIGTLKPNTILLNWYSPETQNDQPRLQRMVHILRGAYRLGCNILICQINATLIKADGNQRPPRKIDIWWHNAPTGRLSLLLAHLMKQTKEWEDAQLTVLTAEARHHSEEGREALANEIQEARIVAELEILEEPNIKNVIARSADSDLVFMPFRFKADRIITLFDRPAAELMRWMATTVLIQAAEDIDLDAEPESGEAAVRAQVLDQLEAVRKIAAQAQKATEAADGQLKTAQEQLVKLQASTPPEAVDALGDAESRVQKAQADLERSMRKSAKADAKLELAAKEAAVVDPLTVKRDAENEAS
ncbi:MAG: amino acid permease [Desulfatitalea sp.]|nr:amino acid permease [Desulfatitalea sp.]